MGKEKDVKDNKKSTKRRGQWAEVWRRLKQNKMAMVGLGILIVLIFFAVFANQIADYDDMAIKQNSAKRMASPDKDNWLGTDHLGRDIFARIVHGSRVSLMVGIVAVGFAIAIGGTLGAIAGFYGGTVDNIIMRIMDVFLAIPSILLAIAIVAALGGNLFNLMIAVGISSIPQYARIVRASVLSVKDEEYIDSARAIGASDFRIITKHIIPNSLAPVIVQGTLGVASAILSTSGLAFIGLGIPKPQPEWGAMLSGGRQYLRQAPHITTFPGLAIMITILALNLLGDGLRDALDPRLKQ